MSSNCKNDICISIHINRVKQDDGKVNVAVEIMPRTGKKIEKAWRKAGYTDELITSLMQEAMGTLLDVFNHQGEEEGWAWEALLAPTPFEVPDSAASLIEA